MSVNLVRTEKNVLVVVMCMAGIELSKANEEVSSLINSLLEVCPEAVLFEGAINLSGYLGLISTFQLHNIYHVPSLHVDAEAATGVVLYKSCS